ncbi:hypothetical protein GA830_00540 [Mesorhizobium sp. NBSH29]|uniref:hypothetical protein n=1 Tax=Mesorhizobium sp. NBSH29 TaxID=2654249 RepID=UPI0018967975|nr:hypothetical protein [Mesorhizobium sp. NBSH29]QPC85397.1 hypothetical protein GA830_00540 [Mesorhizobium sp. NBSH29]
MGSPQLADFLTDFASLNNRTNAVSRELDRRFDDNTLTSPPLNVESLVSTAVIKAEADVTDRLTAIYEATLQAERDSHAHELERIAKEFGASSGTVIAVRLAEMETAIGELATSLAARILGGILTDDLRKRSLEKLAATIRDAIRDNEAVRIQVRGPQSLFETLADSLGDRSPSVTYVESPGFDLTVAIDGNVVETRLSEWSEALAGALS